MTSISVLVDYRPVCDEWYVLRLILPDDAGPPIAVSDRVRRGILAREEVVLTDRQEEEWRFHPETIRAFWTRTNKS